VERGAHTVPHEALLVAHGVPESGRREVIGIDVGQVESEAASAGGQR
jgi:transposase-like protein